MAINMVMKYCASLCSFSFYCREKWASRDWLKEKCICICMEYISIIFGPIAQKNKQAFWNRINKYFITPDTFNTQGHACSQEDIISRRKEERGFLIWYNCSRFLPWKQLLTPFSCTLWNKRTNADYIKELFKAW